MTKTEYMAAKLSDEVNMGHLEEVERLLEQGVDINCKNSIGNTPLMEAVRTGQAEMVRLLLNSGADTVVTNYYGQTAQEMAAQMQDMNLHMAFLLKM